MRSVIQFTSWISPRGGGIPPVVDALSRHLLTRNHKCVVAALDDNSESILDERVPLVSGRVTGPPQFGYSSELHRAILSHIEMESVIHVHGLWMYPGVLARRCSTSVRRVARVVSPHGMLDPWALKHSKWKKALALSFFEGANLRSASCLHALCLAEANHLRSFGLKNKIAVIPNGVDPSAFEKLPDRSVLEQRFPRLRNRRWILFMSRLHPKKGLPNLIRAWNRMSRQFNDCILMVAGPDEVGHEAEVKKLAADLDIADRCVFTGPLHGADKMAALGGTTVFVLPSFSEGFSMAVLEAAAAGVPVLLTPHCNFPELVKAGAAVESLPNVEMVESTLRELLALPTAALRSMGSSGKTLINKSYRWSTIVDQMVRLYAWALEGGSAPEFVC